MKQKKPPYSVYALLIALNRLIAGRAGGRSRLV